MTGAGRVSGKSASLTGGSGVDTVYFGLASFGASLTVKLGDGDDFMTFLGGTLGKAKLDGGNGNGDAFTGLDLLPAPRKVKGFEMAA